MKALVRVFHLIRAELQNVIENDYDGLALQHQGDCVLGIAYLPTGEDDGNLGRRRRKGLDVAIGLQSSMEHVLKNYIGGRDLHVATGEDVGKTVITRLGIKGEREMIALGPAVDAAQRLQERSSAQQIRVTKDIYDAINDDIVKDEFEKDGGSYVSNGLTFSKIDELKEEAVGRVAASVHTKNMKLQKLRATG